MSRPPMFADDPINITVSVKVNGDTLKMIEDMADGQTRSAFLRQLIWAEAARRARKK